MNMNSNNQAHFQSARKSTVMKQFRTPNSKHKHRDNLIVHQSVKSRLSNRKSLKRNMVFYGKFEFRPTIKKGSIREQSVEKDNGCKIIDKRRLLQSIYQKKRIEKKRYQQEIVLKDQRMNENKKYKKKVKETRSFFLQQYQKFQDDWKDLKVSNKIFQQRNLEIKNMKDESEYVTRKKVYEITSDEFGVTSKTNETIPWREGAQKELVDKISILKLKTQQMATANVHQKNLGLEYRNTFLDRQRVKQNLEIQMSQIFVLKIQLSSNLCSGFIVNQQCEDKRLLFNQDFFKWDLKKIRRIDYEDLKRFILLQLYRGWKKLLRKLSYQSSQYQVLFGEIVDERVLEDLVRELNQDYDRMRESLKKQKFAHMKLLAFYSQSKIKIDRREKIVSMLQGFNNGLIVINQVFFNEGQEIELVIRYRYLGDEQLEQRFVFQEYDNIDEQKIMMNMKSYQKRIFCWVQIPIIVHGKANYERYDNVYGMMKKRKMMK